ncbi:hypothetical protein KIN20_000173 [Parelaphostrongylus tenuis]|uniref:Uncharacterized protein n=1 Tax=Parelaphostrongylus tenuis TaxID=148309 RepID=A0AAD5MD92_PARTN|nr:hypothetical protein KIN20_000173 [Parelaphostrongylus tenuis]
MFGESEARDWINKTCALQSAFNHYATLAQTVRRTMEFSFEGIDCMSDLNKTLGGLPMFQISASNLPAVLHRGRYDSKKRRRKPQ